MELKLAISFVQTEIGVLLIVPYGIETSHQEAGQHGK